MRSVCPVRAVPPAVRARSTAVAVVVSLVAAAGFLSAAEPTREWTIDTAKSKLVIHVAPGGLLSPTLHPHLFQPDEWSGEITWDPKNPRTAKLEVRVSADSLHEKGEKFSAKDVAKIEGQAKGPAVLDVAQYPKITYEAHEVEVTKAPASGKGEFLGTLNGTLTLHGKSQPVGLAIQGLASPETFQAGASGTFRQTDFGIKPYKTALGTISVKDEVTVEITIVAVPAKK